VKSIVLENIREAKLLQQIEAVRRVLETVKTISFHVTTA